MNKQVIPLFPLHTVLFPGGALSLRIFEPRYLSMISQCLRSESGFGVCLIRDGSEVGDAAHVYPVGTLAEIHDWHQRNDGLLGISARGVQSFNILEQEVQANQLIMAEIELRPLEVSQPLPSKFKMLSDTLARVIERLGEPYTELTAAYDDATWVSQRLTETMPIAHVQRQLLLEMTDPLERLEYLAAALRVFEYR